MRDYRFPRDVSEAGLPLIAIPTTAGTGSEATRFTIITDETSDEKMLCAGLGFMPIAALIDYELTLSLPPRVTADTGIDALTHAIEAYVSRKASLYSDSQALEAMRLLAPNLRTAFHQPDDRAAREAMMLGATLAGIAFSNASVALVHGMSRPIGAFFHVPHGLSNAMLLPAITASIPAAPERYADCARAMGVAAQTDGVEVANDKLLAELRAINQELKVPSPEHRHRPRTLLRAARDHGASGAGLRLAGQQPARAHGSGNHRPLRNRLEPSEAMQTLGNLINNEAVAGRSERHATVYNPATGEPRLYVSLSSADETREAIAAAQAAFDGWSKTPPLVRARVMFRFANCSKTSRRRRPADHQRAWQVFPTPRAK